MGHLVIQIGQKLQLYSEIPNLQVNQSKNISDNYHENLLTDFILNSETEFNIVKYF